MTKTYITWKSFLKWLSIHGEVGVSDLAVTREQKAVMDQMYFTGNQYWERHPDDIDVIRITQDGLDYIT